MLISMPMTFLSLCSGHVEYLTPNLFNDLRMLILPESWRPLSRQNEWPHDFTQFARILISCRESMIILSSQLLLLYTEFKFVVVVSERKLTVDVVVLSQ